jgi:glycosyltransferase involved in cell wall biosynthesis
MKLTIILPSEAKLEESEKRGLLPRWKTYIEALSTNFELEVYSCDSIDFSKKIGVQHKYLQFSLHRIPYANQILYNIFLLLRAKKMTKVIRVISVGYIVLPIIKKFFYKNVILSYHYDYKTTTEKDFGGIKGFSAHFREKNSIKSADYIICSSKELSDIVYTRYRKKSVVIPNFIDTQKFRPLDKEEYILYAGRIYWHKGIEFLLKAFMNVEKRFPSIELKIAGWGDVKKYRIICSNLKLQNVNFLGSVENDLMPNLMGKAKIFILPSLHREGNPKALMEAMACGCACIVTDVPGNKDLITNMVNGILVKPNDVNSLAEAIIKLVENNILARALGAEAQRVALKYSIHNTLLEEISLLKRAMK